MINNIPMFISDYHKIDQKKWENFVFNHPKGNIFHTPEIIKVYEITKNYYPVTLFATQDQEIIGILTGVIQKENKGFIGNLTSRIIIFGGPLTTSPIIWRRLIEEFENAIKGKAIYTQIRNFYVQNNSQIFQYREMGYSYEDHLNILVNLSISESEFWKGIKKNRKEGINKARKRKFHFEVTNNSEYLEKFYTLLKQSYRKIGLPYPDKSFFVSLDEYLQEKILWFILKEGNKPIIILSALKYKQVIYAFYIGITNDTHTIRNRPVDLFYYEVMLWGIRNGIETFDWMGAGKPDKEYGVRKFKIQYGGDVINLGRYEKIHKPFTYRIAKLGLRIWQSIRL